MNITAIMVVRKIMRNVHHKWFLPVVSEGLSVVSIFLNNGKVHITYFSIPHNSSKISFNILHFLTLPT